jgi:hypothetical protein
MAYNDAENIFYWPLVSNQLVTCEELGIKQYENEWRVRYNDEQIIESKWTIFL